jgi:hypothetical protein
MLIISPSGKIIGTMRQKEAAGTPVLLGLGAESASSESVKMLVDVVFQSVPLKRPLRRGYWYLGSTGAEIELQAVRGKITGHTEGSQITVKYTTKSGKDKKFTAKIEPSVKVGEDVEISAGEISVESTGTREGEAEFISKENLLAVVNRGDAVVWQESMVRGEKAVRDFLFGNLKLWAQCKWSDKSQIGRVRLHTSAFFFDDQKRRLSGWKALLMEFTLAERNVKIPNRDGVEVQFAYTEEEPED